MEKIYWIYDEDSLEEINHNLKTYGGHVVTITAVPTKTNNYPFPLAHALVVVNNPGHNEFPLEEGEETEMEPWEFYRGDLYEEDGTPVSGTATAKNGAEILVRPDAEKENPSVSYGAGRAGKTAAFVFAGREVYWLV